MARAMTRSAADAANFCRMLAREGEACCASARALLPFLFIVLSLSLAGWPPAGRTAPADDARADRPQKVLRYAFEIAETGFDPVQITDLYSRVITSNIFDAPLRYAYLATPGTLEANVTDLPEVSTDYRRFTFRVHPGIYFTDDPAFGGKRRELVAADFVYSIKRIYDPRLKSGQYASFEACGLIGLKALHDEALKSGRFDYDRAVDGVRALDRYTFEVRVDHPNPRFATNLADPSVLGTVAREVVERYGDRIMEHPVGTGPFMLSAWRRSSLIVLARNPGYREDHLTSTPRAGDARAQAIASQLAGRRLPLIDRVEISIIEESQPRWLAFLDGEQDLIERLPRDLAPIAVPGNQPSPMLARRGVTMVRRPEIDVAIITFNMDDPVIGGYTPAQVALRRAIGLATDTDELIRSGYKYQAIPAQSMIQPETYGYDPALRTEMGSYDLARAAALLDAYGYRPGADGWRLRPDGTPLVVTTNTEPDQRSRLFNEIFKRGMDAIHLRVDFKPAKWPENLRLVENGQYMMWLLGESAASPDGEEILRLNYGPGIGSEDLSRFHLEEFDRDFLRQASLPDGPERLGVLRHLNELELAYSPYKAIVHRYKIDLVYPWVKNFTDWPFVRDWWRYVDIDTVQQARRQGP